MLFCITKVTVKKNPKIILVLSKSSETEAASQLNTFSATEESNDIAVSPHTVCTKQQEN